MAKRDKVTVKFMLEQNNSWKENHKITVESKDKTPRITLEQLYKIVVQGFAEQRKFNQYVLDVFKRNNLK